MKHVNANEANIDNEGAKRISAYANEGVEKRITFWDFEKVRKQLVSVGKVAEKGHYVIFDEHEAWIVNKTTKDVTRAEKRNGTYKLDLWLQGFGGQAAP